MNINKLKMIKEASDAQIQKTNVMAIGMMTIVNLINAPRKQTKKIKRLILSIDPQNNLKAIYTRDVGPARRLLLNESQSE